MKKTFLKGIVGFLAAFLAVLFYLPINAQAAAVKPAISLVADWYNTDHGTFVMVTNNGSLGTGVNGHSWQITEKAVDLDNGNSVLSYTETRTVLTDPIYVNTGKFRENAPVKLTITVTCPDFAYAYSFNLTIKNNENIYKDFSVVSSASAVLYNGQSNKTLVTYRNQMGNLAKASVNAFIPAGYMTALDGAIVFDFQENYKNKNGLICINIPEGYQAANRIFKLVTVGQGGIVTVCDDVDLNPATISALVNFNGFAVSLIYTEADAAAIAVPAAVTVPSATLPVATAPVGIIPAYGYIADCKVVEEAQGAQCINAFNITRPLGYAAVKNYSVYVKNIKDVSAKNGYVTFAVDGIYSEYKLITVDKNGAVQILDDQDNLPGYVTFCLNYNGYAAQLIAR